MAISIKIGQVPVPHFHFFKELYLNSDFFVWLGGRGGSCSPVSPTRPTPPTRRRRGLFSRRHPPKPPPPSSGSAGGSGATSPSSPSTPSALAAPSPRGAGAMAVPQEATLRELTHASYNEPLRNHGSVTFKLVRTGKTCSRLNVPPRPHQVLQPIGPFSPTFASRSFRYEQSELSSWTVYLPTP